jgi:hypothetical protein
MTIAGTGRYEPTEPQFDRANHSGKRVWMGRWPCRYRARAVLCHSELSAPPGARPHGVGDWFIVCFGVLCLLYGVVCIVEGPKRLPGVRVDEIGIHYLAPPVRDIPWDNVADIRVEARYGRRFGIFPKHKHWFKVIVLTMKDGSDQDLDTSALVNHQPEPLVDALKEMHAASSKRPEPPR